jgi:hypothetical protein
MYRPRRSMHPQQLRRMTEFTRQLMVVPEHVIVDVSPMTNRMSSMFTASIEFVFDSVIEALHDRHQIPNNIRLMNRHLANILSDEPAMYGHRADTISKWAVGQPHSLMDQMITIEQCALDMGDVIDHHKLYLYGRFLPYQFEGLLAGGSLLLKRIEDYNDFCARIFVELGFDEGE